MKLGQIRNTATNIIHVSCIQDSHIHVFDSKEIPSISAAISETYSGKSLSEVIKEKLNKDAHFTYQVDDIRFKREFRTIKPINPPEVWAVGVTYKRQAKAHDSNLGRVSSKFDGLYSFIYENKRAEVFFKGFDRTMVGPKDSLWLRSDSMLVLPEAELVLVIGRYGRPIGITLGNDLTAWDIERECPLYLNQAKIWDGSGSIGPYIIPIENVTDLYNIEVNCNVTRQGETIQKSTGNTSSLRRSIEELCHYLCLYNSVPIGSVLFTGTSCVVDHELPLKDGDIVEVSSPTVGSLLNGVVSHPINNAQFNFRG